MSLRCSNSSRRWCIVQTSFRRIVQFLVLLITITAWLNRENLLLYTARLIGTNDDLYIEDTQENFIMNVLLIVALHIHIVLIHSFTNLFSFITMTNC